MDALDTVSYDQYRNIPSYDDLNLKAKIIFSNQCYENIKQMSFSSMNNNRERGRFFVGRMLSSKPKVIYFDYNTSEFECERGPMGEGGAVNPTTNNYLELNEKIKEYLTNGIKPVVLHFHSHPRFGHYESFSDQDLQLYAKMQAQNELCISLGMLGFPINETSPTIGMCVVNPENAKIINEIGTADFIRCEDICYINGNDIYKVGGFEKKYNSRLHKQNINRGIVRQFLTLPSNAKVCAEGIDPNTGKQIKPTCVGYTDTAGYLYFTNENLTLEIPNMKETNISGLHR